jgi:hypothetical protein
LIAAHYQLPVGRALLTWALSSVRRSSSAAVAIVTTAAGAAGVAAPVQGVTRCAATHGQAAEGATAGNPQLDSASELIEEQLLQYGIY